MNKNSYDRLFKAIEIAGMWKKLFTVSLFLIVALIFSVIFVAQKRTIYPYIIEVEKSTGRVITTRVLKENKLNISDKEIRYFLSKYIVDTRTITKDKKYFNKMLNQNILFLSADILEKFKKELITENVNSYFENRLTKDVILKSILKTTTDNVYEINWQEKTYNENGKEEFTNSYRGVFRVGFFKPNESQILYNPFGIVIDDFSITKLLN